ncbi:MAG TPA: Calx-beta domain-containing protein [Thermoanaerobaculia bacterium]|jgi:hypothetical protein|nr:Calx-beta domain-containing protein [Thermoanaerobaculia bacterium]
MNRRIAAGIVAIALVAISSPAAVFVVSTNADSGVGSFDQAIIDANTTPGPDDIHFNIGAGGPQIITTGPIPIITEEVVIDGTTQPGYSGTPIVTLDGDDTIGAELRIQSSSPSTIRGLVIIDMLGAGVRVENGGATISGNYIGVNASGGVADPNAGAGIEVRPNVDGTVIIGNVISANNGYGIYLHGTPGVEASDNNIVQGNIIGLDAQGINDLGNLSNGIGVDGGNSNRIGGTAAGEGNVISGNGGFGIRITATAGAVTTATGNIVQGNMIGTTGTGTSAVPNSNDGIALFGAQQTTIGGSAAGARNLISGNAGVGINLSGIVSGATSDTVIQGNLVGTDISGSGALPNSNAGISLAPVTNPAFLTRNQIGGPGPGEGNRIWFNLSDGIAVNGGIGNPIQGNSIDLNGGLGIDLSPDGATPNDPNDTDAGPNNLQNRPVITAITVTGSTTATATLNSTPARLFRIEFFSTAGDPSGFGEGGTFLGFTNATADASGNAAILATLPTVASGTLITATATDQTTQDTSEFSNAVAAVFVPPVLNVNNIAVAETDSGTTTADFTVTLSEPSSTDVTFQFSTSDGTAAAPGDYLTTTGSGTILAGETSTTVAVPVVGDTVIEPDETFTLTIANIVGATAGDVEGVATIVDDDAIAEIPTLTELLLAVMAALLAIAALAALRT